MTLRAKRVLLTSLLPGLIRVAQDCGYEPAIDYARRTPEGNAAVNGHPRSLHLSGLAVDLVLYRNGRYVRTTAAHEPLGEWWEAQHRLARWGGRFRDGNHYSIAHGGRS